VDFDGITSCGESFGEISCGRFGRSSAHKELGLDVVHTDGPDIASGLYNDGSHRSISSED
jgi:hypothetical protein